MLSNVQVAGGALGPGAAHRAAARTPVDAALPGGPQGLPAQGECKGPHWATGVGKYYILYYILYYNGQYFSGFVFTRNHNNELKFLCYNEQRF